jgi:hypothetical protein
MDGRFVQNKMSNIFVFQGGEFCNVTVPHRLSGRVKETQLELEKFYLEVASIFFF